MKKTEFNIKKHMPLILVELFFLLYGCFIAVSYKELTVLKGFALIFTVIVGVVFFFAYQKIDNANSCLHKVYMVAALGLGLMYMIIVPAYRVPDEAIHFYASYQLTNEYLGVGTGEKGGLIMRAEDYAFAGTAINVDDGMEYVSYLSDGLKSFFSQDGELVETSNTTVASITYSYWVSSLGILIARLLHLGALPLFFMGRFFNLVFFVGCFAYAIKKMPVAKQGLFAIGLLPIVMQQSASYSHDVVINAFSIIVVALTLHFLLDEKSQHWKSEVIVYGITLALLIPTKGYSYGFFILFPMLLAWKEFKKSGKLKQPMVAVVLAALGVNLGIVALRHLLPVASANVSSGSIFGEHMIEWCNEKGYSLSMLLHEPKRLIQLLYGTMLGFGGQYWSDLVGLRLASFEIVVPELLRNVLIIFLFVMFVKRTSETLKIEKDVKILFAFISVLVVGVTFVGLLFAWTPVSSTLILGIQGRYFYPILPLVLLLFYSDKIKLDEKFNRTLVLGYLAVSLYTAMVIFGRF